MNPGQRVALDYYQRLSVPEFSSVEAIKKSYRGLALRWHPDRHQDPAQKKQAEEIFKRISEAYDVLTKNKEAYDALLQRVRQPVVEVVFGFDVRQGSSWYGWTTATNDTTTGAMF